MSMMSKKQGPWRNPKIAGQAVPNQRLWYSTGYQLTNLASEAEKAPLHTDDGTDTSKSDGKFGYHSSSALENFTQK